MSAERLTPVLAVLITALFVISPSVILADSTRKPATLGTAAKVPTVKVLPAVGPPIISISTSGKGFRPHEAVDIFFDTTDLSVRVANARGAFSKSSLKG